MENQLLHKASLFSNLNDYELEKVAKITRTKTFNKGDIIFFDTEPYLGFYIVVSGLVKIYKISKDGREHILHLINPYNTFAEVPLFENFEEIIDEDFRYPANAMAIENDTKVILIPAMKFAEILEGNSKLCMRMISGLAKRLRHLNHHVEELMLKDVTKRVAGYILAENKSQSKAAKEPSQTIKLNITKNDLASYLGTIPETLSRTLKKLQDENIIDVKGKSIKVNNIKKLKEAAS
jgi:CRP/FNR family transcriptional regulator